MKELMRKVKKRHLILLAVIACSFTALQLAPIVKAQADSSPVIYDSTYIDKMEANLKSMIQSSSDDLKKQIAATSSQTDVEKELADLKESMVFKIIKLPAGKTLVAGASTEMIIRNKDRVVAYVDKTATGGISNLISGKDIPNGAIIPDNQLLLVPKADGRGVTATQDADIMIKGMYTIK